MYVSWWHAMVACLLFAVASARAAEVTLAGAIDLALKRNPALVASRYELTASQARVIQAGLRPNPELLLEFENFAGRGELSGVQSLETTLSLSQVIELGDKRRLRSAAALADSDVASIEQRARQLDVLADVTRRFVEVVAAQERVRLAGEATQLARQTLDAINVRVEAARTPVAEGSRARIALTRALIEERQAQAALRAARYSLAACWGDTEPEFTDASGNLFAFAAVHPLPALLTKIEHTPDITFFASQARLRDAELQVARAQSRPNLTFSLGVRRLEATDDLALVAGVSAPLSVYDRNQGVIREAKARRVQSDRELEAALVRLRSTLQATYEEMTASREAVEALRADAIPQAVLALDQVKSGYERGRFSFLELASAQQELLGLRASVLDAATDYHRLLAELERLTSEPLTTELIEGALP
jgi:cobalt-zinc-cadmium efflux system outer membrane protein